MRKILISTLIFLTLVLYTTNTLGFEYQLSINDTFTFSNKTIKLISLNDKAALLDVSGEERTPPLEINKPRDFGNVVLIVRSTFYVKEKEDSFAMIDFCEKKEETCNNIDDDCDGRVDDGVTRECGNLTTGICTKGEQKCVNGEWGYCENKIIPQNEICNNLDDNCNGIIDEDITRPCGNAPLIGSCKNGLQKCSNGTWNTCEGYVFPTVEKCNNKDDNCDGNVDENLEKTCGESDKGVCKLEKTTCKSGSWETCKGAINPTEELCDGLDNDCDGVVDNDCKKTETDTPTTNTEKVGFFKHLYNWVFGWMK